MKRAIKILKIKAPVCECGKTMIERGKNLFFCDNKESYDNYKPHIYSFKKGQIKV